MKQNKGFTIVELIITIAVIGILAGILLVILPKAIANSHAKSALSDCHNSIISYEAHTEGQPAYKFIVIAEKYEKYYFYMVTGGETVPHSSNPYEFENLDDACAHVNELYADHEHIDDAERIQFAELGDNVAILVVEQLPPPVLPDIQKNRCSACAGYELVLDGGGNIWVGGGTVEEYGCPFRARIFGMDQLSSGRKYVAVCAAETYYCAIDENGALWACGNPNFGNKPDSWELFHDYTGEDGDYVRMHLVNDEHKFQSVSCTGANGVVCNIHSGIRYTGERGNILAIDTDGHLFAWGDNSYGQLATEGISGSSTPIAIMPEREFVYAKIGEFSRMWAIDRSGNLFSWGNISAITSVETENTTYEWTSTPYENITCEWTSTPYQIGEGTRFICADGGYACAAVDVDGGMWTFGYNVSNCLAQNLPDGVYNTPGRILPDKTFKKVVESFNGFNALDTDGHVWSWGSNEYGLSGTGEYWVDDTKYISEPELVYDKSEVTEISRNINACFFDSDGKLSIWGYMFLASPGDGLYDHNYSHTIGTFTIDFNQLY